VFDVHIYLDTCSEEKLDETEYVRDTYFPDAYIFRAGKHIDAPSGTWNILHALKSGYEIGADYIFIVEEDVFCYPDYMSWHLAAQASGDYFATCGRLKKEYRSVFYTNPGSCFHRDKLGLVVPHINDSYFADRKGYLESHFGSIEDCGDLDDGLIRRVINSVGGIVKYPDPAVVAHSGFWAYNKLTQYKTHGTIQERIEQLRNMLPGLNPKDRYLKDWEPYRWARQRIS